MLKDGPQRLFRRHFEGFLAMPFPMQIACAAALLGPFIALTAILSGAESYPRSPRNQASEQLAVLFLSLPGFAAGILMLLRHRSSVHLFGLAYVAATVGPMLVSGTSGSTDPVFMAATLGIGFPAYTYLLLSPKVRRFLDP